MSTTQDKNRPKIIEVFDNTYDSYVDHVALRLRQKDFNEIFAMTGGLPYKTVRESWRMSSRRWIVFNGNEPVAVLGVRPQELFGDIGIPWLLGTDGLNKIKKFFVKNSKPIIEEMKKDYEILINYVDARYKKTVYWLDWCGFIIEEAEPFNEGGLPFHRFFMEAA